ncbi:MAG: type II toxin-antitoxin system HicA family toxin [Anaerovoracaceae bacterium]
MPITAKEMQKILEKNGFVEVRQNGSHKFFINSITGKRTTVPFHNKVLGIGIEKAILKQAGIKKGGR